MPALAFELSSVSIGICSDFTHFYGGAVLNVQAINGLFHERYYDSDSKAKYSVFSVVICFSYYCHVQTSYF